AGEDRMLVVDLIIDFTHCQMLSLILHLSVRDLSAGIARLREVRKKFHGYWIKAARRNLVVDEALIGTQCYGFLLALSGRHRCEISGKHFRGRNVCNQSCRVRTLDCSLIASKEEDFIPLDWTAHRSAKLVPLQRIA